MHEQSLVRTLLKQVEVIRRQHGAEQVTEVRVEIGPLSGVEPLLLASAFEQLASGSTAENASLVIDEVPLRARCAACDREFEVKNFVFRCRKCAGNVQVIGGDTLHLVSVSVCSHERAQEHEPA